MLYSCLQLVTNFEWFLMDVRECYLVLGSWRGSHQKCIFTAVLITNLCPPEGMLGLHAIDCCNEALKDTM